MITLILENETKKFNLKNNEREKSLVEMFLYLSKYNPDKIFKITTDIKEKLKLKVKDIRDCQFHESIYCKATIK